MSFKAFIIPVSLCAGLAGCGDTIGEQVLVGGGVGAGAAAIAGSSIAGGAAIGALGNVAYCEPSLSNC